MLLSMGYPRLTSQSVEVIGGCSITRRELGTTRTRHLHAFFDPCVDDLAARHASLTSSWLDSGPDQLSVLTRFPDVDQLATVHHDGGSGRRDMQLC